MMEEQVQQSRTIAKGTCLQSIRQIRHPYNTQNRKEHKYT